MGKLSNKLSDVFGIPKDDDYDDYDEYDDDEYEDDDEDEEEESGGLFSKSKKSQPVEEKTPKVFGRKNMPVNRNTNQEVCVIKPSAIDDSREISETLLSGKAVIINFEGLHVEISQRIMDFVSGTCYAIDGNLQKVSNFIFIATPNSVDISGDFQELFGGEGSGNFDLSGFKSPLL